MIFIQECNIYLTFYEEKFNFTGHVKKDRFDFNNSNIFDLLYC